MVRTNQRIAELQAAETQETRETDYGMFRVMENAEENRIQILFPAKPAAEVRAVIKQAGFRWSRYHGAWQRHLNNAGMAAVGYVVSKLIKTE